MSEKIEKPERATDRIKRFIPVKEIKKNGSYDDMIELSEIFQHPIIEDKQGTWRWMPSNLQHYIMKPRYFKADISRNPYYIDLNDLCVAWYERRFSIEEYMKWQMNEGYSLCGFAEIFAQRWDKSGKNLIDLVIEHHKKPENKGKNWMLVQTPWDEEPWLTPEDIEHAKKVHEALEKSKK